MTRKRSSRRQRLQEIQEEERMDDIINKIVKLRQVKSSSKASFTRTKHKLLELIEAQSFEKEHLLDLKKKFVNLQKKLIEICSELAIE